jgi:lipid II:glycine glycyltransferase (peptidoglycan interpeptide bridge formation enzyme)
VLTPRTVTEREEWNSRITGVHGGHILQSWDWGEFKGRHGWQAERIAWDDPQHKPVASVQILSRRVTIPMLGLPLVVIYAPRGPCLDWSDAASVALVLHELKRRARESGTILVKVDPEATGPASRSELHASSSASASEAILRVLPAAGWRRSPEQIQFRNTMVLDLRSSEEELLAGMKQKTRYNLRLAERHGVEVRPAGSNELDVLYRMYAETSLRDGFAIRGREYYADAWGSFLRAGLAQPLLALVESEPVAGLIVYRYGKRAWFLFGMSRDLHRDRMPNYMLQWEAIRWARAEGCESYDLWGAPEELDPSDALWGVYKFKEGFGARPVQGAGAWDYSVRPRLYWMYTTALPRLLSLMRRRGRAQTRGAID